MKHAGRRDFAPDQMVPAPPASLHPAQTAFFFDFDGTLASIVDDPRNVRVSSRILDALTTLYTMSGGALAIVSGRSIAQLDGMLAPLTLPAAGVHGLERRDAGGRISRAAFDGQALIDIREQVGRFIALHPGLVSEVKPGSVTLHYRKRPDLAEACRSLVAVIAASNPAVRVVPGKMVYEMKLADRTKGDAIADFMAEPPFAGRRPLFAGDDVTDEDGFAVINRHYGISIRIGEAAGTCASHGVRDIDAFHDWLVAISHAATAHGGSP